MDRWKGVQISGGVLALTLAFINTHTNTLSISIKINPNNLRRERLGTKYLFIFQ